MVLVRIPQLHGLFLVRRELLWCAGLADEHDRADLAVGGGDGQTDLGGQQYREGCTDLDGETSRRSDLRQIIANRLDNAPSPQPQSDGDTDAAVH